MTNKQPNKFMDEPKKKLFMNRNTNEKQIRYTYSYHNVLP